MYVLIVDHEDQNWSSCSNAQNGSIRWVVFSCRSLCAYCSSSILLSAGINLLLGWAFSKFPAMDSALIARPSALSTTYTQVLSILQDERQPCTQWTAMHQQSCIYLGDDFWGTLWFLPCVVFPWLICHSGTCGMLPPGLVSSLLYGKPTVEPLGWLVNQSCTLQISCCGSSPRRKSTGSMGSLPNMK